MRPINLMTCLLARTYTQNIRHKFSVLFVHRRHGASKMTVIMLTFYFLLSFLLGIIKVHMFHDAWFLHLLCKAKWFHFFSFMRCMCRTFIACVEIYFGFFWQKKNFYSFLLLFLFWVMMPQNTQHCTLYSSFYALCVHFNDLSLLHHSAHNIVHGCYENSLLAAVYFSSYMKT